VWVVVDGAVERGKAVLCLRSSFDDGLSQLAQAAEAEIIIAALGLMRAVFRACTTAGDIHYASAHRNGVVLGARQEPLPT
jgi:hypothetical protein